MELRKYIYRVDTDIYLSDNVVAAAKQEGKIPGHYNLKEIKNVPREDWSKVKVSDILVPHNKKWEMTPDSNVMKALELMIREDKGRSIVMENDKIVGLITRNGIARYLQIMVK